MSSRVTVTVIVTIGPPDELEQPTELEQPAAELEQQPTDPSSWIGRDGHPRVSECECSACGHRMQVSIRGDQFGPGYQRCAACKAFCKFTEVAAGEAAQEDR